MVIADGLHKFYMAYFGSRNETFIVRLKRNGVTLLSLEGKGEWRHGKFVATKSPWAAGRPSTAPDQLTVQVPGFPEFECPFDIHGLLYADTGGTIIIWPHDVALSAEQLRGEY